MIVGNRKFSDGIEIARIGSSGETPSISRVASLRSRRERRWWDRKFLVHQEGLSDDQLDIAGHSLSRSYSPSLPLPLSLSLPLFRSPSFSLSFSRTLSFTLPLPPGPLASRRGDRIISEAFARFLPPSPSSVFFPPARRGESLIIVTGHGASSFTYSVELVSSRSRLLYSSLRPRLLAPRLAFTCGPLSPFRSRRLPVRAAHFTIHFVHLPFKE